LRSTLAALTIIGAVVALQVTEVAATNPAPAQCSPGGGAASPTRLICPPDPNQAAYDQLKARLGDDIARALDAQKRLSTTLDQYTAIAQGLSDQATQEETAISNLEDQIAKLDTQIQDTQDRIDVEKQQLGVMARAIYRQPDSLWVLIARTGNLEQALLATSDMVVAGQRAHTLQTKLEADLKKLETDRKARQDDLDRENANRDLLVANLNALQDVMATQSDISSQLTDLVGQLQDAQSGVRNQSPDAAAALAQLLEAQVQSLIQKSYQTAWIQARVGTGRAMLLHQLPLGKTLNGLRLSWPMTDFQITQPFGPSDVALEPPYGPYRHFHYGVDISAPLGTSVTAAADGVIVAVGHSGLGYGNYVIVGHGGGIATLYGHLLDTTVKVGDWVARGQQIGHEGSTGLSTGPHVHFELRLNDQVLDPMPYLPVPGTNWHG
jgi:murein DD-endopeptidase MepM/ murein hydrolase activator NlpD